MEQIEFDDLPPDLIHKVKNEYYFLLQHIDSLITFIRTKCVATSEVFLLPSPKQEDIGKPNIDINVQAIEGEDAVSRVISHLTEFTINQPDQPGLMSKRLPGVIRIFTHDTEELILRINKVNTIKDELTSLIRTYSPSEDEQFELTKRCIPMAIRKQIGRHIHYYEKGELKSVGFSFSNKTAMSKPQKKAFWLEKLEKTRKNIRSHVDVDSWMAQLDIEEAALNMLPDKAYLRTERPIRKAPIANIYLKDRKTTITAHSPIFIINDNAPVRPLRSYKGKSTGNNNNKRELIIPRWHLYLLKKI